ncbi:expressed unknown protein [Seminavis robusta]|uniref:Uncharacterized protein n=1 Tax=Seminavis robusta TaxID=568900 RepID=A0A9N8EWT8_9STRA|nr:expressed unknown protein [Seminavis robusta]|eukprot:Sro2173_g317610.1 n/a (214) ;mRNA; f:11748-12499
MTKIGGCLLVATFVSLLCSSSAQLPGHSVGDEVCVAGYVMDNFCIARGTLLDNPTIETLRNPEAHSVHCLVDVPPCYRSPWNILVPPSGDSEMYSRGYYMTDNELLLESARAAGQRCSTCDEGGTILSALRLQVIGIVQPSEEDLTGLLMHKLSPTQVSVINGVDIVCDGFDNVQVVDATISPTAGGTSGATMIETMVETMIETAEPTYPDEM